jgi:hypothetical protein
MKALKLLLSLIIIISLESCTTLEITQREVFLHVNEDGTIDEALSGCWERNYHYGMDFLGPLEKWVEVPMLNCRHIYGHNANEYKEVIKGANSLRIDYRQCNGDGD